MLMAPNTWDLPLLHIFNVSLTGGNVGVSILTSYKFPIHSRTGKALNDFRAIKDLVRSFLDKETNAQPKKAIHCPEDQRIVLCHVTTFIDAYRAFSEVFSKPMEKHH